ncbi:MFS transporter [Paenibacillus motobuensis]|uniref:MFS transporter n=1 Tax=Paenibacillus motobuensis TaxID=295324 RepID=A0ABN0Y4I8_9BACL
MANPVIQEKKKSRFRLTHVARFLKRPAPLSPGWKGASLALGATALCLYVVQGYNMIGARGAIPYLIGIILFLLATVLLTGVIALLLHGAKKMPTRYIWLALTSLCLLIISFIGPMQLMFIAALSIIVAFSLLGMLMSRWFTGKYREAKKLSKILSGIMAGVASAYILLGGCWLFGSGNSDLPKPYRLQAIKTTEHYPVAMANPAEPGTYPVKTLTYGSADSYRKEFNAEDSLITRQVDGSAFVENWSSIRTKTFGFGPEQMALNGLVWYPEGDGPFPLVIAVHGNHLATDYSDPGYAYLGNLLASKGYIFASIDENFLNTSPYDDLFMLSVLKNENPARGWLILEHLKVWEEWNSTKGNPFFNKADMSRISLIGHSRGGEAVAIAAAYNKLPAAPEHGNITFNYNFGIRSIISIAGTDGQYKPADQSTPLSDVSYLTIQGSHDMDVSSFATASQYSRIGFSNKGPHFKASVYVYGANHGQFNTTWGRADIIGFGNKFYNTAQLLPEEDQLRVAKVLISSFLDATLQEQEQYLSVFKDLGYAKEWLPDTMYISNYWDADTTLISSFDEDIDLSTTTIDGGRLIGKSLKEWKEEKVRMKYASDLYSAVQLGWDRRATDDLPSYTVALPDTGLAREPGSSLVFSMADRDDQKKTDTQEALIDLTVQVADKSGNTAALPLSSNASLLPMLQGDILKWPFTSLLPTREPVFQNFAFRLDDFKQVNPAFQPEQLSQISFIFDKTDQGSVYLNDIGIRNDATVSGP